MRIISLQESGAWLARLDEEDGAVESEVKVWSGNAKTCAMSVVKGRQRLFLGTEPADVLISDDMGATWHGTDSFAAIPDRQGHIPQCLSSESTWHSEGSD